MMNPPPGLIFEAARPQDAATIRKLVRANYAKWVPVVGREPMPMKADYAAAIDKHRIEILCLDGRAVGVIEMDIREDHLWIENIAVSPDRQGMGLGRQLLAHAERRTIEAKRSEIRLLTNAAFAGSVILYEKAGFKVDRTEPFMGGTILYMSRKLVR